MDKGVAIRVKGFRDRAYWSTECHREKANFEHGSKVSFFVPTSHSLTKPLPYPIILPLPPRDPYDTRNAGVHEEIDEGIGDIRRGHCSNPHFLMKLPKRFFRLKHLDRLFCKRVPHN